jgi:dTDP-4-amino-4,6-dideoxygalactose transaminase
MRIPVHDSTIQHRLLQADLEAAMREVLLKGQSDVVPQVVGLEEEIGALLGGCHAVGVQSGSAGLFLTLRALHIGPGDEVITVPNSDIATTASISHAGARVVLCDVEPGTMTLDPQLVQSRITARTRALLPVHLYGHPAAMHPLAELAERFNLHLIEDATLAFGATYHGRFAGTIGTAGVFSFAASKVIGGTGNGGMVVTRNPILAHRIRLLRGYGMDPSEQELPPEHRHAITRAAHLIEGYNLRLDSLQAAILRVKLPYRAVWQQERQQQAERYAAHFAGSDVRAPLVEAGCTHAWRNYVVTTPARDRVRRMLHERGIATHALYAPPVHLQPVYSRFQLPRGSFPIAEHLGDRLLGLPIYAGLPLEHVDEIAKSVIEANASS